MDRRARLRINATRRCSTTVPSQLVCPPSRVGFELAAPPPKSPGLGDRHRFAREAAPEQVGELVIGEGAPIGGPAPNIEAPCSGGEAQHGKRRWPLAVRGL